MGQSSIMSSSDPFTDMSGHSLHFACDFWKMQNCIVSLKSHDMPGTTESKITNLGHICIALGPKEDLLDWNQTEKW